MVQYKQTIMIDTVLNIMKETIGTLYFDTDKHQSLYVWDRKNFNYRSEFKKMEDGTVRQVQPNGNAGTDTIGRRIYKQFDSPIVFAREKLGQWFLVSDTIVIKWDIKDETKTSYNMTLQKAIGDFHGRRYTVWFNPLFPLSDGPWKFKGIPGLIIEAYDEKNHVKFDFISMTIPATFQETLSKPEGYNTLYYSQYLEKKIKAINEAPKVFESQIKQRGGSVSGSLRTNIIERSN